MITDAQDKRLTEYKNILAVDISEQLPDEGFAAFCRIKGYLQALVDLGQIGETEMAELVKKYTF